MTLFGDRFASGWRPLRLFWLGVACTAGVAGTVLALLGPPHDAVRGEQTSAPPQLGETQPGEPQPAGATPIPPRPPARLPVQAAMAAALDPPAPAASTFTARGLPQTDQPPRRTNPPSDQAPDSRVPANAPSRTQARIVLHPAQPDGAGAIAERLAARAGIAAGQIDVGTAAEPRSEVAIRFYSESDHATARRLGQELGRMGYTWRLDNRAGRSSAPKDQAIEIWLTEW